MGKSLRHPKLGKNPSHIPHASRTGAPRPCHAGTAAAIPREATPHLSRKKQGERFLLSPPHPTFHAASRGSGFGRRKRIPDRPAQLGRTKNSLRPEPPATQTARAQSPRSALWRSLLLSLRR